MGKFKSLYKEKNYHTIIKQSEDKYKKYIKNPLFLYVLGNSHLFLNHFELAIKCYKKLLKHQPNYNEKVYLFLSISFQNLNQNKKATDVLKKGIKIFPQNIDFWVS